MGILFRLLFGFALAAGISERISFDLAQTAWADAGTYIIWALCFFVTYSAFWVCAFFVALLAKILVTK